MAETSSGNDGQPPEETLDQLRRLLLGPDLDRLTDLEQRIRDKDCFSSEVARVLPRAMAKSAEKGDELCEAMVPTIEKAVGLSIKKDLNKFATALFPVIGPAIRKSISQTIRQMFQSINQAMEHRLSWQGIKWRIQSARTGVPFAHLVMLNSLAYRVEQVFLIHRETGLLLHHAQLGDTLAQDADMVSSMLSAIGDFVTDSFSSSEPQQLESLQLGHFRIVIEQAPVVALAVVIRGDAPSNIGTLLTDTLEDIHKQLGDELASFNGDTEPFAAADEAMRRCLIQSTIKPPPQKMPLAIKMVWTIVIALALLWSGGRVFLAIQQNQYLETLNTVPGVVVTRVERSGRHLTVTGLKEALAENPRDLLDASDLKPQEVTLAFTPFFSLEPEFVKQRLIAKLEPPDSISIEVDGTVATLTGRARHRWIDYARRVFEHHPMIIAADFDGVVDIDREALKLAIAEIEQWSLLYEPNQTEYSDAQREHLRQAVGLCLRVIEHAGELGIRPVIRVRGSTDSTGSFQRNKALSLARAERVRDSLVAAGVQVEYLVAEGLNTPVAEEQSPEEQRRNRRAFFSVDFGGSGKPW